MIQHSIEASLPRDVATSASPLLKYQQYPVFSWAWWWRRALLFAPLAIIEAVADGNVHGVFSKDAVEAFGVALRCAIAGLLFIGGGTLLAVAARHAKLRQVFESILITIAIVLGFFIADASNRWANRYHDELMCAHRGVAAENCPRPVKEIDDTTLGVALEVFVPVGWYFLFGGGFAMVSYFKERRSLLEHHRCEERAQLQLRMAEADARLSVLQAQIEPHFLFNTLASLRSLMSTEPQRAVATIDALVAHLRATLPQMRQVESRSPSTLGQQLEICRSYLEVMRVRMGSRLEYEVSAPTSLEALPFPPLMLLSLVENAIKHGVESSPGMHSVHVQARALDEHTLEVTVIDDGPGLQEGVGTGVGLANVRAQLSLRYGAAASFELINRSPAGVLARLRIPLRSADS
jgi:signal transduction histidine kinase